LALGSPDYSSGAMMGKGTFTYRAFMAGGILPLTNLLSSMSRQLPKIDSFAHGASCHRPSMIWWLATDTECPGRLPALTPPQNAPLSIQTWIKFHRSSALPALALRCMRALMATPSLLCCWWLFLQSAGVEYDSFLCWPIHLGLQAFCVRSSGHAITCIWSRK
jgi:hypothetical protein